jgi:hypothetical protein
LSRGCGVRKKRRILSAGWRLSPNPERESQYKVMERIKHGNLPAHFASA